MWKSTESRNQLIVELHRKGYTMKEIREATGASKSVISYHRRSIPVDDHDRLEWRLASVNKQNTEKLIAASRKNQSNWDDLKDAEKLSASDVWQERQRDPDFLGFLATYWAEGTKTSGQVSIVNTDPGLIRLSIRWFLRLDPGARLDITVKCNPDQDMKASRAFWESAIQMPITRVNPKGWVGKKQKSRVPHGSCVVRFNNWRVNAWIGAWISLWRSQLGAPPNM